MATVNLVDVCKYYGQQRVLDGVNISIDKGEFVVVIGPSGCGKSTLLRLVSGLDELTSGDILINNQSVNNIPAHARDMAMVFQSYALYPHMTVFNNMAYGLKMRGMKRDEIAKRVNDVASMLKLTEYLERKPSALSGGQRQRVAMGRAIVRNPSVFLFDEPLSNLDAKLRIDMRHEIKKLHQKLNTTSLYVTHDQTEAMTMGSRVLILNQGKVEQIGSPQTLFQEPASMFVASFIGSFPMNFVPASVDRVQQTMISTLGFNIPMKKMLSSNEVVFGIRPEDLILTSRKTKDSIPVSLDYIDNLGSDKLIHVRSICGDYRLSIRALSDLTIAADDLAIDNKISKLNVFDKITGLRVGGWA